MKKCWVVVGMTGGYSDRTEWLVKAFLDKERAEAFISDADAWLLENKMSCLNEKSSDLADYEIRGEVKPPFDPDFRCDYTGSRYCLSECDLDENEG